MPQNSRSFTMVELVVVILVISVLAALGLVRYEQSISIANERDAALQLRAIYAAQEQYYNRMKEYLPGSPDPDDPIDIDQINQGLGLNIVANGIVYSCQRPAQNYFECSAKYGSKFEIGINAQRINVE